MLDKFGTHSTLFITITIFGVIISDLTSNREKSVKTLILRNAILFSIYVIANINKRRLGNPMNVKQECLSESVSKKYE